MEKNTTKLVGASKAKCKNLNNKNNRFAQTVQVHQKSIKVRLKQGITEMYPKMAYMVGQVGTVDKEMAEHKPKLDKPFYNPYKYGWDATEGVWVRFDDGNYLIPCKYLDVVNQTSDEFELVLMISVSGADELQIRNDVKLKDTARTRTYTLILTREICRFLAKQEE